MAPDTGTYPPIIDHADDSIDSPQSSPLDNDSLSLELSPRPRRGRRAEANEEQYLTVPTPQVERILSVLKTTLAKNANLQSELTATKQSLRLYEHQLSFAQSEIRRAEDVVKALEERKNEAEARSARDRDRARKLVTQIEIWNAREEGRQEGYYEGLEMGRSVWMEQERRARSVPPPEPEERRPRQQNQRPITPAQPAALFPPPTPSQPPRPRPTPSRRVAQHRRTSRGSKTYTITNPGSEFLSSSSSSGRENPSHTGPSGNNRSARGPSPPPTAPPAAPPAAPMAHPRPETPARPIDDDLRSIIHPRQPSYAPLIVPMAPPPPASSGANHEVTTPESIRPIRSRTPGRRSSPSHPPVFLPPDNYIPMSNSDGYIAMPPPHELHAPSEMDAESVHTRRSRAVSDAARSVRSRGRSRRNEQPEHFISPMNTSRVMSDESTRLSQYALISSPKRGTSPEEEISGSARDMAEEWRRRNSDVSSSTQQPLTVERPQSAAASSQRARTPMQPPPPPRAQTPGILQSSRMPQGPRRPREIILPTPLANTLPPARPPMPNEHGHTNAMRTSSPTPPNTSQPPAKTPLAWIRQRFQRSYSSPGQPVDDIGINVEPPSGSPSQGSNTDPPTVNPVLLSPEDANERPLPDLSHQDAMQPIHEVLQTNELPPGFIPQNQDVTVMRAHVGDPSNAFRGRVASYAPSGLYEGSVTSPAPLNRPISLFASSES